MIKIKSFLKEQRSIVEKAINTYMLKATGPFEHNIKAMRYSLMAGGKRIRPILCLAAGEVIDNSPTTRQNLLPIACALECIHTYSLIHDDLPAMDDDELRRGKPTNHVLFGEAEAILAGDGLLTWAFDLLTNTQHGSLQPQVMLQITNIIARASGSLGMVGGQSLDIANENNDFPFEMLQTIHSSKTGALITCSMQTGAIGAGATPEQEAALTQYGIQVGLAFQIVDDLLNITSTTEQLGKAAGSDEQKGKATYPAFFGVEATREKALEAINNAKGALEIFGDNADTLRELADYIYLRSH
jgi:geranylgeranyl diphosphate synthase, type II